MYELMKETKRHTHLYELVKETKRHTPV